MVFGLGLVLGDDDEEKLMNDAETLIDDDISAFLDQGTGNEGEGNAIRPKGKCKAVADHKVEEIDKR